MLEGYPGCYGLPMDDDTQSRRSSRSLAAHLAVAALLLLLPSAALAQEPADLEDAQVEALLRVLVQVETVEDLAQRGRISAEVAARERTHYLGQVAQITSHTLTLDDLRALRGPGQGRSWRGYLTFLNLLWLLVGVFLLIALGWLTGLYVVPLVAKLPKPVIEAILYAACGAFVLAPASFLTGGGVTALAVVGCLGVLPLLAWTHDLHFRERKGEVMLRIYALLVGTAWAAAAVFHASSLIATGSVVAFMVLTGTIVLPFLNVAIHAEEKVVPAVTLTALLALLFFGGLAVTGQRVPAIGDVVELFAPGSLWVGTIVYFSGCMTLASRHYHKRLTPILIGNGVAIVSGLIGLYVGSVWEIHVIREGSGSFLAFYLLFKFFELPWKRHGWAWASLLLAGLLYGFALFAERYPEYFLGF